MSIRRGKDPRDSRDWRALRKQILIRDGYTCTYCGQPADTVDHRLSIKAHPDQAMNPENLTSACKRCNSRKGSRSEAVFYYSSEGRSACRLDVGFPPSWDSPIEGIEPDYLDGDGTFSFRMRSAKYPIDWERVKAFNPDIYLEVGETYKGAGYLTLADYGRSPYLDTDFEEVTAKPFEADESRVNRILASVGGKAKVEFVLTRTSEKSHKTKLDLDLSKSKKARESQSKKRAGSKRTMPPGLKINKGEGLKAQFG
jgi:hypothetical protein